MTAGRSLEGECPDTTEARQFCRGPVCLRPTISVSWVSDLVRNSAVNRIQRVKFEFARLFLGFNTGGIDQFPCANFAQLTTFRLYDA